MPTILPTTVRLRSAKEFRFIYAHGRRYDANLMTAFVWRNNLSVHRLGITVSRKVSLLAVERNRSKRLIRESFRLSHLSLRGLEAHYDWVINAKRSLINVRVAASLSDFEKIVTQVTRHEKAQVIPN